MDLVLKSAGLGFFITVLNNLLSSAGKSEWGPFITLAGMVGFWSMLYTELYALFSAIKVMFML